MEGGIGEYAFDMCQPKAIDWFYYVRSVSIWSTARLGIVKVGHGNGSVFEWWDVVFHCKVHPCKSYPWRNHHFELSNDREYDLPSAVEAYRSWVKRPAYTRVGRPGELSCIAEHQHQSECKTASREGSSKERISMLV